MRLVLVNTSKPTINVSAIVSIHKYTSGLWTVYGKHMSNGSGCLYSKYIKSV